MRSEARWKRCSQRIPGRLQRARQDCLAAVVAAALVAAAASAAWAEDLAVRCWAAVALAEEALEAVVPVAAGLVVLAASVVQVEAGAETFAALIPHSRMARCSGMEPTPR